MHTPPSSDSTVAAVEASASCLREKLSRKLRGKFSEMAEELQHQDSSDQCQDVSAEDNESIKAHF